VSEHLPDEPVDEQPVDEQLADEQLADEQLADAPVEQPGDVPADGPGDPRVAAAVRRLEGLGDSPPEEHVEVYEQVHQVLQETLDDAQRDRSGGAGA
jgi:hypothetical protein